MSESRFACPCCGYLTIAEPPTGSYEICEVCGWEDDNVQAEDPAFRGGANKNSLNAVRASFLQWRLAGFPRTTHATPAAGGGSGAVRK